MPVICSRSTRLTVSMRVCISRNCGTIRRMIRPMAMASTGTLTSISQDSPTSSRSAMITPPTHMIGAATSIVQVISDEHLHLLHVVGVAGDQRRGAEPGHLAGGEPADLPEDRRAHVAAEAHRGPRAEVDRGDRADDLDQADQQHPAAGAQDVVGVAPGHALVDDVGVEAGQVERGHGADELEQHHRPAAAAGRGAGSRAAVGSARPGPPFRSGVRSSAGRLRCR